MYFICSTLIRQRFYDKILQFTTSVDLLLKDFLQVVYHLFDKTIFICFCFFSYYLICNDVFKNVISR